MILRHKVTSTYFWLRNVIPYIIFLLLVVTSCGFPIVTTGSRQQGKDSCSTPTVSTPQPELVLVDVDTKPLYPESYFRAVLAAVADRVLAHITLDSAPLTVVVNYITSDSINRKAVSFTVPGLPALPAKPVLQTSTDPYKASQLRKQYKQAVACWQDKQAQLQQQLAQVQVSLQAETDKLMNLPNVDPHPTNDDVWGALYDASQTLSNFQGVKYLFIASGLQSNTDVNAVQSLSFSGVAISVVDFACQPASVCEATQEAFTSVFRRSGASSITFSPPGIPESSQVQF